MRRTLALFGEDCSRATQDTVLWGRGMWKGGFSDLELELGRRVSQVGLGDAAVTTNHKISVLKEHILWYTDIYIYMFLPRREMPHLYSYSIGQSSSHVHI